MRGLCAGLVTLGLAFAAGPWACSPQTDWVARRQQPIGGDCATAADGCGSCDTAERCMTDPACANAAACKPMADAGVDAGPDAGPEPGMCRDRACDGAPSQSAFCSQDGSLLLLGDGCNEGENPQFHFVLCSRDKLVTSASLHAVGDIAVDGANGGNANFEGPTTIEGALLYGAISPTCTCSNIDATRKAQTPPNCARATGALLDFAQTVHERATDNDNASAVDALSRLSNVATDVTVTLPCGRYYVPAIDGTGGVTIHAQGNLALFVDGRVQLDAGLHIDAPAGARVTLVINGAFHIVGGFQLGDASANQHLLAAAKQVFFEGGENVIGGTVYVPGDELLLSAGTLSIHGAAYVQSANLGGATELNYAQNPGLAAQSCSAP